MQFDLFYQAVKKLNLRRNIIMFGCGTLIFLYSVMKDWFFKDFQRFKGSKVGISFQQSP
ncbi:hypothetical protein [Candidatus Lokiarchaeum ossiferum]|uniref:hypothetical protein n=1 Tax=Candidatus Lokiarchaeum ossiferum TaxID=2951803 RepID=UPI00352D257A